MKVRLLLPAGEIPAGSRVTKPSGNKIYELLDKIVIYLGDGQRTVIPAESGVHFLAASNDGRFNAIPSDQELAWVVDEEDLLQWLEHRRDGENQ